MLADHSVNCTISARDAMYRAVPDEEGYLRAGNRAGKTATDKVRLALELAEISPKNILDYGCGHGRVLRWFQSFWPDANLTAADVTTDQIKFCAETFGADPFLIDESFANIRLPSEYDLIWLGSILTHMDRTGWRSLIDSLIKHVSFDGVLCFSFAGRRVYEMLEGGNRWGISDEQEPAALEAISDYESSGFGFLQQRESQGQAWGRSIVNPEWVLRFCFERGGKVVLFSEQAYARRQDIVCVQFPKDRIQ